MFIIHLYSLVMNSANENESEATRFPMWSNKGIRVSRYYPVRAIVLEQAERAC